MVSPRDALRNGITPCLPVSFPPPTPTACSGAGDGRMRAGHLSHSARHRGGGSRGGRAARVWLERPVLGSHLSCVAASYLKVTNLGHPQPSELARKVCPIHSLFPMHLYGYEPLVPPFPEEKVDFCLGHLKSLLYSSNQDRAQRTHLRLQRPSQVPA